MGFLRPVLAFDDDDDDDEDDADADEDDADDADDEDGGTCNKGGGGCLCRAGRICWNMSRFLQRVLHFIYLYLHCLKRLGIDNHHPRDEGQMMMMLRRRRG